MRVSEVHTADDDTEQPVADNDTPKTFNDAIQMASALKIFCLNKVNVEVKNCGNNRIRF